MYFNKASSPNNIIANFSVPYHRGTIPVLQASCILTELQ